MANVVLTVLSMTIGFFFLLVGVLKLTPSANEEIHKDMRKTFIRSAKVFPFVNYTGWKPNAHIYRKTVGTTEVICGTLLVVVPGPVKEVANAVLLILMFGAVYTHYALKDGIDKMTPALVFGLLLACRLIVHLQVKAREKKSQVSTPPAMQQVQERQRLLDDREKDDVDGVKSGSSDKNKKFQ